MEDVPIKKSIFQTWQGVLLILLILTPIIVVASVLGSKTENEKAVTVQPTGNVQAATPTQTPESPSPIPTQKKAGSTNQAGAPEGQELYNKIVQMHEDGEITGVPFAEFAGDPIVDANPKTQSVQFGLKYEYEGKLTNQMRVEIAFDFDMVKALAEKDSRLLMPDTKQLRLFVLTFHDKNGIGRGEVEQMFIDDEPQWSEWK